MNERFSIIGAGVIAGLVAAGAITAVHSFTAALTGGRFLAILIALISTGILYALVYISSGSVAEELDGIPGGVFAGAVGAIVIWAIGEALFGPFHLTGLLVVGFLGGLGFSAQIDPKPNF